MGMSASQARLIALTARMSDVEYEGQQINQQRLTLANKISDIYAQMENLDVPTPPSPLDYQITTYTGSVDATGRSVDVAVQDNGKLAIGVYREGGVNKLDRTNIVSGPTDISTGHKVANSTPINTSEKIGKPRGSNVMVEVPKLDIVYDSDAGSLDQTTREKYFEPDVTHKETQTVDGEEKEVTVVDTYKRKASITGKIYIDNGGTESMTIAELQSKGGSTWKGLYSDGIEFVNKRSETPLYNFGTTSGLTYSQTVDLKDGYSQTDQDKFTNGNYYTDPECKNEFKPTFDSVTGKPSITIPASLYQMKEVSAVDGHRLYSMDEASREFASDIDDVKQRIKATMADDHVVDPNKAFENWFIYSDSDGVLHAVEVKDGKATEYGNKDNTAGYVTVTGVDISSKTPDALGNLKVTVNVPVSNSPGAATEPVEIKLKKGKASGADSDDYKAAMAKYEADKIKYDHEQKELNNQTSVWQQEDKKLDLKLKRLDTERNALNTEIDAVKKVIQDSTDKGFKTFSG